MAINYKHAKTNKTDYVSFSEFGMREEARQASINSRKDANNSCANCTHSKESAKTVDSRDCLLKKKVVKRYNICSYHKSTHTIAAQERK